MLKLMFDGFELDVIDPVKFVRAQAGLTTRECTNEKLIKFLSDELHDDFRSFTFPECLQTLINISTWRKPQKLSHADMIGAAVMGKAWWNLPMFVRHALRMVPELPKLCARFTDFAHPAVTASFYVLVQARAGRLGEMLEIYNTADCRLWQRTDSDYGSWVRHHRVLLDSEGNYKKEDPQSFRDDLLLQWSDIMTNGQPEDHNLYRVMDEGDAVLLRREAWGIGLDLEGDGEVSAGLKKRLSRWNDGHTLWEGESGLKEEVDAACDNYIGRFGPLKLHDAPLYPNVLCLNFFC